MTDKTTTITVSMNEAAAEQLAQFCKRSTFNMFYDLTETYLSDEERQSRAYQMIAGLDAVQRSLADAGYAPR